MTNNKKLIEIVLPLEVINAANVREKSIRHGHPSTLHLWWARRPLAAARAVIFAQMVDDPSAHPDIFPTEKAQEKERQRLFRIIEDLVHWENTNNEKVLQQARDEIWQSWRSTCAENALQPRAKELFDRYKLPAFHDPFAGGGALPLEAQRLGLESFASDLNPVAVLINKAMIEIPPKFSGKPPVNPSAQKQKRLLDQTWPGAQGLAEDVRYYGQWMRDEAEKRIGYLYPKITVTTDMTEERADLKQYVGQELTVIAFIWVRTVKSPNPAYANVHVPLASTFMLSKKSGKQAFIEPFIENRGYHFKVRIGNPQNPETAENGTKLVRANFICLMSGVPITGDYIKAEGIAGRLGSRLMAVVAEGQRGRVYLSPTEEIEMAAYQLSPSWRPDLVISGSTQYMPIKLYGLEQFSNLFTDRQLVALTTLSNLVQEAFNRAKYDALSAGLQDDGMSLANSGVGAQAYAEAIALFLGFQVDQLSNHLSTMCAWHVNNEQLKNTFARQALPMTWDYAETNPFSNSTGSLGNLQERQVKGIQSLAPGVCSGHAVQVDATTQEVSIGKVISTDPPYFDNVPYADLSDYFYVWLRHSLRFAFPEVFSTLAVPKSEELVAFAYRHESKEAASIFFMKGMERALHRLAEQAHPAFPITIYYAFRQSETDDDVGTSSTGWEIFLEAVIRAGFALSGTWPIRTEQIAALKTTRNALASSIILVCRKRKSSEPIATRREFLSAIKSELPAALIHLQQSNIAPVDLAQAAIGPGMAIFTRYDRVLDADGKPLSVRQALSLINQILDEVLTEQEGDFDSDSRWALAWFEQVGFIEGEYGRAETLSKAKDTSVDGMAEAGILVASRGKVRLLKPNELPKDWDPTTDKRLTNWEMVHHLIRALESGGESAAADIIAQLGAKAETARELCYRLYTICERKKRSTEALSYNALVQSWPEINRLASDIRKIQPTQPHLL